MYWVIISVTYRNFWKQNLVKTVKIDRVLDWS